MSLILKDCHKYWFHGELVKIVQENTNWDERRVKQFLTQNPVVTFKTNDEQKIKSILDRLESGGFYIELFRDRKDFSALLYLGQEESLKELRMELESLSSRIAQIESGQGPKRGASLKDSSIYRELSDLKSSFEAKVKQVEEKISPAVGAHSEAQPKVPGFQKLHEKLYEETKTKETEIGKYWLSRIGIFTLVLGIVFFISYSSQFIGPFGKILLSALTGIFFVGTGNYLARHETLRRWVLALIGGGWSILYFTLFAAYQIPATKIIDSPYLALAMLALVSIGSIANSIKFNSSVLVVFSYFLAFLSIGIVEVSTFTLIASSLLAFSTIIVSRKLKMGWLALLGFISVYLIHTAWLKNSIFQVHGAGDYFSIWDSFVLPFADTWRVYPMISTSQSLLHQGFLILYWVMFSFMGFLQKENSSKAGPAFTLSILNNFVFSVSYLYHLHAYHPEYKVWFSLVMGAVFLLCAWVYQKRKQELLSDQSLAFSVALFAMTIPLYFDGAWITYAWSSAAIILTWLGVRHHRFILMAMSWAIGLFVLLRLMCFDYLENSVLFNIHSIAVNDAFFIFTYVAVSFLITVLIYQYDKKLPDKTRGIVENVYWIASSVVFADGVFVGGLYSVASILLLVLSFIFVISGVRRQKISFVWTGASFLASFILRLLSVDYRIPLHDLVPFTFSSLRLGLTMIGILGCLVLAEWVRTEIRKNQSETNYRWLFQFSSLAGAFLLVVFVYDEDLKRTISILWGILAFSYLLFGFRLREAYYRWIGLALFGIVLLRLFFYDLATVGTLYRIFSFLALGVVLIGASYLYTYYSKKFLSTAGKK